MQFYHLNQVANQRQRVISGDATKSGLQDRFQIKGVSTESEVKCIDRKIYSMRRKKRNQGENTNCKPELIVMEDSKCATLLLLRQLAPPPPLAASFWSSFWKNKIPHNGATSRGGYWSTNSPLAFTLTLSPLIWLSPSAMSVDQTWRRVNTFILAAPRSCKFGKADFRNMWRNEPRQQITSIAIIFQIQTRRAPTRHSHLHPDWNHPSFRVAVLPCLYPRGLGLWASHFPSRRRPGHHPSSRSAGWEETPERGARAPISSRISHYRWQLFNIIYTLIYPIFLYSTLSSPSFFSCKLFSLSLNVTLVLFSKVFIFLYPFDWWDRCRWNILQTLPQPNKILTNTKSQGYSFVTGKEQVFLQRRSYDRRRRLHLEPDPYHRLQRKNQPLERDLFKKLW